MAATFNKLELDKVCGFFPASSRKVVLRLLDRARKMEARKGAGGIAISIRLNSPARMSSDPFSHAFAHELSKALGRRPPKKEAASVRKTAPDTGGRPFHLAHSTVTKGSGPGSGKQKSQGRSAAHMKYIERAVAVETSYEVDTEVQRDIPAGQNARRPDDGSWDRDRGDPSPSGDADLDDPGSSAGANQRYIENPVKLANGENVIFSFGTIGATIDERVAFWELLEEHEREKDARVQSRLIIELPHEATPAARHEMVRGFCRMFDDKGIPYWAALHAPGAKNDSRNYHAHIVYSERPAKRMVDPADGMVKWDFAIREAYKTSSRNVRYRHPCRQNRDPDLRRLDAIPAMRKRLADVVNTFLIRDDVKGADGEKVRYDPRSYEVMGLDVVPAHSIKRISAAKISQGPRTLLDEDYTPTMIEELLREAAARRDPKLIELFKLDQLMFRLATAPWKAPGLNRQLPRELRISPFAHLTRKGVKAASLELMRAGQTMLRLDMMQEATTRTLRSVMAATGAAAPDTSAEDTPDPGHSAAAPDKDIAATLFEQARLMLAESDAEATAARRKIRFRIGNALAGWQAMADPKPEPSKAQKLAAREPTVTIRGRTMTITEFMTMCRMVTAMPHPRGGLVDGRPIGPAGPQMPTMATLPSLGLLTEVSEALTKAHAYIARFHPDVDGRIAAVLSMTMAGRKLHAEMLLEKRAARDAKEAHSAQQGGNASDRSMPLQSATAAQVLERASVETLSRVGEAAEHQGCSPAPASDKSLSAAATAAVATEPAQHLLLDAVLTRDEDAAASLETVDDEGDGTAEDLLNDGDAATSASMIVSAAPNAGASSEEGRPGTLDTASAQKKDAAESADTSDIKADKSKKRKQNVRKKIMSQKASGKKGRSI